MTGQILLVIVVVGQIFVLNKLNKDGEKMVNGKDTIKIADLCGILGIGRVTAYKLARDPNFPCIKVGSRKIIPKEAFYKWLNETALNRTQE